MLFSFSPFCIEKSLRLTTVRGTCFLKPQETGVLDVVSRSRGMLEQFSDVVDDQIYYNQILIIPTTRK